MLKGIYLTLLVGPVVPVPVPQIITDALASIQVMHNTTEASGFELTFTLTNRSPLQTIFLLASGNTPLLRVMLVLTINDTPQVLMDGVTTMTQVTPGSNGEATLTVTGKDLTKVMDSNLVDSSGIPFPAMPAEARVLLILSKYAMFGLVPMVIPSLFPDIPLPTERTPTQQGSDLYYVQQLAAEVGYVFYIDPGPTPGLNTAYWVPEIKVGSPQPALNFNMNTFTNVESLNFNY